jgi:hypothetical protein
MELKLHEAMFVPFQPSTATSNETNSPANSKIIIIIVIVVIIVCFHGSFNFCGFQLD